MMIKITKNFTEKMNTSAIAYTQDFTLDNLS